MRGLLITFEGTEGCGKSTQLTILAQKLTEMGHIVRTLREPGGTPIGEEIRHTLKHSTANANMAPETELLLMNASRAQLVREVITPALAARQIVLCDRFYDSTIAYQAFGRRLSMASVQAIVDFAVGDVRPDLTLLLKVPITVSEQRRKARIGSSKVRDRMEEADREFFERVEQGYESISAADGMRVRTVDATQDVESVSTDIWKWVQPLVEAWTGQGVNTLKSLGEYKQSTLNDPESEISRD
ncbi:MAG TPA: dTMP kinase [Methylomirabilota bacterium]|nr:dTMP kinase [Methylomirabilota bacterium]